MRNKGFTLIELLVVMAIIGMLASALVLSLSKAGKIATDMKCKANLKNLGQATHAYVVENGHYPDSYPFEWDDIGMDGNGKVARMYYVRKGWVNWTGPGRWTSKTPQAGMMTMPTISGDLSYESITNGTLWRYTGKDPDTYLCTAYKKAAELAGERDIWRSYVMNHRFHWHNKGSRGDNLHGVERFVVRGDSTDRNAERVLLYAELPADNIDTSEEAADGIIDPHNADEHIGFNHRVGKRNVAHVVYVDGHVGVLMEPEGADEKDMLELTKSLCDGAEISRDILQKMR